MTRIAIYGVGLIGGSLALCFKNRPGYTVVGHSSNPESVRKYLQHGVVDEATTSFAEAAQDADFIFVCVPVGLLDSYLQKLSQLPLKDGCIVTDVGSTKASVVRTGAAIEWPSGVHFIGGHPMAGSERSGVEAAHPLMFENAYYVLTPDANTPPEAVARLEQLLKLTRAHIVKVDAVEHDNIVGAISHLPHIIAAALVNQVADLNEQNELYERLAAGGFRDITRIASCDPIIWRDILLNNRDVLLKLLKEWQERIGQFMRLLEEENAAGIEAQFRKAGAFRSRIPERQKGAIISAYDLYVDVPDTPGVIGNITSMLGELKINLSNIRIMESREDVPGVLCLTFRSDEELQKASAVLKENGYSVHV